MTERGSKFSFAAVDWGTVLIYVVLVLLGLMNIYAAVYDSASGFFDFSSRAGSQLIWFGVSLGVAIFIMLLDSKYYYTWAYPVYWLSILVLLYVLAFGHENKGARSWIMIGSSFGFQPSEFVKFTVALALSRLMNEYSFNLKNRESLIKVIGLITLPLMLILLQNDTGSAIVFFSFMFMLFREGLNPWIYVVGIVLIALFIFSFLFEPIAILTMLLIVTLVVSSLMTRCWRDSIVYAAAIVLTSLIIFFLVGAFTSISYYTSLLVSVGISIPLVLLYSWRKQIIHYAFAVAFFVASIGFTFSIDYVFSKMQLHQQKRILDLLGVESDLNRWGYNVHQSKIAIGSGGFFGKGYLEGTQTKYDFVPEQTTDFIFCTVGEEWGFLGSTIVILLFGLLIFRLMKMGERQHEAFGRVYCYSVASIFLVHLFINIGMTIGVMPVIGIPLPFFSYGGSSLLAFTVLLAVAVKLDSSKKEIFL